MRYRWWSRPARCTRYGWSRRILSDARAIYAHGRRVSAGLLNHITAKLRRDSDFPTTNTESKGQGLLSHHHSGQQMWSGFRERSLEARYVRSQYLHLFRSLLPLRELHCYGHQLTYSNCRGWAASPPIQVRLYRDLRKIPHKRRQCIFQYRPRNQKI